MSGPLRVGIALDLSETAPGLWVGDALQAASFLAMVLAGLPLVGLCVALDAGPGRERPPEQAELRSPLPVMTRQQAMETLDLVIELGARLPPAWSADFTGRGGVLVAQGIADELVTGGEAMAFNGPAAMLPAPNGYSEIWVWPGHAARSGSYHHYTALAPVRVVPPLWSPAILEHAAGEAGRAWAYAPGAASWHLAVLEPNRSSVAACHLPLILCDAAFRRRPGAVAGVWVGHGAALCDAPHFRPFAHSLELVRQGRAWFLDAEPPVAVLGARAQALVSHHWGGGPAYRHYEALHGGFPLIHNVPLLGDCGYRYGDFDPEDGADCLLAALACHDADLPSYRAAARRLLAGLDPLGELAAAAYGARLAALFPGGGRAR
jgi:hypothetical protein